MTDRRVAITGIGCLSALGLTREEVWANLVAGRCGIGRPRQFDTSEYRSQIAAEIPEFDATDKLTPLERRRWSRTDQIAVFATAEALDDAGFADGLEGERVAVILGAGTGDLRRNQQYLAEMRTRGVKRARPSKIFNHFSSTPVDVVGERFSFRGPRSCVVAACSSSTIAIGQAADAVRYGSADYAVCGGADVLCALTVSGFNALRLVDLEPCRPFDAGRAGMSLGEAAAVLLLEPLDHAKARGAHIYAELAGYGVACEAYHPTSPEPDGRAIVSTIALALAQAGLAADAVDYINAHGTGTVHNDQAEARAFYRAFGDRAARVPVSGIKAMVGHCLGAAGAIEAAALALSIDRGVVPPTIHHSQTDSECPLDVVPNEARDLHVHCGISTSLAFGGNDSALVMKRI